VTDVLHFLLVPDKAAARRVRRAVASRGACAGTVVGTWGELVDQARRAYLIPPVDTGWGTRLADAAEKKKDAFWSKSYESDPEGTVEALGRELKRLLSARGPGRRIEPVGKTSLSDRGKRHLADLSRLHDEMGGTLPPGLAAIRDLLDADKADATRLIAVQRKEGFPVLFPWQEALIKKLASDCGAAPDPGLEKILDAALAPTPSGKPGSALRHLQENLFGGDVPAVPLDPSVTCLAVRDFLEEAEVAAGMAQKALAGDPSLAPSEIGILIPDDPSYEEGVRDLFARAGLPVAGLSGPQHLRNLGGETVFHFLATRKKPAPAMALSALYASPLMPWDTQAGNRLAMAIMEGEFDPDPPEGASPGEKRMMALIREKHETPKSVKDALAEFGSLLGSSGPVERHTEEARSALATLATALEKVKGKEVPWEELTPLIPQAPVSSGAHAEFTQEGIAIFREGEEPWRPVRLLFVLGFSEGRYPAGPERSPVFDDKDIAALGKDHGYALETAQEGMACRRALLERQLRSVSDRAVFLSPLRDPLGEEIAPCGTTAFMTRLFAKIEKPEDLVLTLERESHRARAVGLALAPPSDPVPTRTLEIKDPDLGEDLLSDGKGGTRHETPSSFDTLLVSPLSWFLARHDLLPLDWGPEELDPPMKGTLAHAVFERLFPADGPLPTPAQIRSGAPKFLDEAILGKAPFLLTSEWYVERRNLMKEIETAALRWREFLAGTKAKIMGVETNLSGSFDGIPISGRTDLLLKLPTDRIFVVDYKKSKSGRRRTCMEKGYDIQTSLYRRMLRDGGGIGGRGAPALSKLLKEGAEIGVLYYMMDDQRSLTDRRDWIPRSVPAVESPGDDISGNGEGLLIKRIAALRSGTLPLNREDDGKEFEKVGVSTYALDASPLLERFVHPAGDGEEEEE
jgi:RecB family exonuclease